MNSLYPFLLITLLMASSAFTQNKLNFSANSAESIQENNETVKVFKEDVKIIDQNRILYTDLAKRYDSLNNLFCDNLKKNKNISFKRGYPSEPGIQPSCIERVYFKVKGV